MTSVARGPALRRLAGAVLRRSRLEPLLVRHGLDRWRPAHARTRWHYAQRWIRGCGIEIGALHNATPLPRGARVRYVDRFRYEDLLRRFAEVDLDRVVRPDLVDDGFRLQHVADGSERFVIANHVLEHAPDALGTLGHWLRVLRLRGVLLLSVPVCEACFDRGRPVTSLEHFVEDHAAARTGDGDALRLRNRSHYEEWIDISEPAIVRARGDEYRPPEPAERARRLGEMMERGDDIHFHTFTPESLRALLACFCANLAAGARLEACERSGDEVIAVVRRTG